RQHGPWDGVLMPQHGAAVSEEYPDADGEIVRRVREIVGPDLPIGVSLDMHANVSQKVVEHSTVTTVYRTNPHLDARDRAAQCAAAAPKGRIVLMDVGDNMRGGSSADSTYLLAEAQRLGIQSFLQTLYDPEAVMNCVVAGVGSNVSIEVGGKTDDLHGSPVSVTGRVR